MKSISGLLLQCIKETLINNGFDYEKNIKELGHMKNIELRRNGHKFSVSDHLDGLIFSLLSNQRPWGPIEQNEDKIKEIFYNFDKDKILATDPETFVENIRAIKCGNRAIKKQMITLKDNIKIFEEIEAKYGSLDVFVTSDSPYKIAFKLSESGSEFKLQQIGEALALEYLRNVGVDAIKPDTHVLRILGGERLGFSESSVSANEAVEIVEQISEETGYSAAYIDALLWLFCANDYGNICTSEPKCSKCKLNVYCNYNK